MIDIFKISIYQSNIINWGQKKKYINKNILSTLEKNSSFIEKFSKIFCDDLLAMSSDFNLKEYKIIDTWTISYKKNDYHQVHNHRTIGLTAIIYVEYNELEHEPTYFIAPFNDPIKDTSLIYKPKNIKEGSIIVFPSFLNHFSNPNKSDKERMIFAFDIITKSNASVFF